MSLITHLTSYILENMDGKRVEPSMPISDSHGGDYGEYNLLVRDSVQLLSFTAASIFYPDDLSRTFLRNVGKLPDYSASHATKYTVWNLKKRADINISHSKHC
jgi:hypothetical protein